MAKQKTYSEKLKDPRWQRLRLEAMDEAGWECVKCSDSESTLHVHHKQYLRGKEPWDYDISQLAVLCESCHEKLHQEHDRLVEVIFHLPLDGMKWIDRDKAACLIAGALGLDSFEVNSPEQVAWFMAGLNVQKSVDTELRLLADAAIARGC